KVSQDIKSTNSLMTKAKSGAENGGKFARYGHWGQKFEEAAGPEVKATLWEESADVSYFSKNALGATEIAGVDLMGTADFKALTASADASAGIGSDGIFGEAKAGAYLLSA